MLTSAKIVPKLGEFYTSVRESLSYCGGALGRAADGA